MDVVGSYPNIPHEEDLPALRKQRVKNWHIYIWEKDTSNKKRGTAIGTKLGPLYSILFMSELEEKIIKESEYKRYLRYRYLDEIIFLWENKLKVFTNKINEVHPTIKFKAE